MCPPRDSEVSHLTNDKLLVLDRILPAEFGLFVHEAAGADFAWLQCPEKVLPEAVCGAETTLGVEETPYDL